MKVLASLKSAKNRDKDCRLIRRKGKLLVINKKNPRLKAKQGWNVRKWTQAKNWSIYL